MPSGAGKSAPVAFNSSIVRLFAIGLTYAFPTVKSNTDAGMIHLVFGLTEDLLA
jgi:hypothetical protein